MSGELARAERVPVEPWDQLAGEPDGAYDLFQVWRALGPGRTLDDAEQATGQPKHVLAVWRRSWSWDARAEAFDEQRARSMSAQRREAREHAAGRATAVALKALEVAEQGLEELEPGSLGGRTVAELLSASTTAARWALGDPNAYTPGRLADPLAAIAVDAGMPVSERIRAAAALERRDVSEQAAETDAEIISQVVDALADDPDRASAVAAVLAGGALPEPGGEDDDRDELAGELDEIMRGRE